MIKIGIKESACIGPDYQKKWDDGKKTTIETAVPCEFIVSQINSGIFKRQKHVCVRRLFLTRQAHDIKSHRKKCGGTWPIFHLDMNS